MGIGYPIRYVLQKFGYDIVNVKGLKEKVISELPHDVTDEEKEIILQVKPFTLASPERIVSMIRALEYIEKHQIEGDIVECGVWKGGMMMTAALKLKKYHSFQRSLYLYDTFEGMPAPSEHDITHSGKDARKNFSERKKNSDSSSWCFAPLDTVKKAMQSTEYPDSKIMYVKGKVENTIPETMPDRISLLRLDTDFYESTLHEMNHLFPLLSAGGILIIDDYGHWQGARKAIDEYIETHQLQMYLARVDYTCRIAVKS